MPLAVTHILVPILLLEFVKKRGLWSIDVRTLLIAGAVGLFPDIDIVAELLMLALTGHLWGIHRAFTHTLIIPLLLTVAAVAFRSKKHAAVLITAAFAWVIHIVLDVVVAGQVPLLYPLPGEWGFNLLAGQSMLATVYMLSALDAVVFLAWLWHEEKYKKIKDFL